MLINEIHVIACYRVSEVLCLQSVLSLQSTQYKTDSDTVAAHRLTYIDLRHTQNVPEQF